MSSGVQLLWGQMKRSDYVAVSVWKACCFSLPDRDKAVVAVFSKDKVRFLTRHPLLTQFGSYHLQSTVLGPGAANITRSGECKEYES